MQEHGDEHREIKPIFFDAFETRRHSSLVPGMARVSLAWPAGVIPVACRLDAGSDGRWPRKRSNGSNMKASIRQMDEITVL